MKSTLAAIVIPFLFLFCYNTMFAQLGEPEILYDGATTANAFAYLNLNVDDLEVFLVSRIGQKGDTLEGGLYVCTKLPDEGGPYEFASEKISDQPYEELWSIDLDHDGDKDLLLENYFNSSNENCFSRAINEGGVFQFDNEVPSILNDSCVSILKILDVNQDGLDDIVYSHYIAFESTVYAAVSKANGDVEIVEIGPRTGDYVFEFINQDTILDFVFEDKDLDQLIVRLSNSDFDYSNHVIDSNYTFHENIYGIVDLTNDGTMEVLILDGLDDELYYLDSIESMNGAEHVLVAPQDFGGAYILDFNFDGALDIYVNNGIAEGLHRNDGSGNFTQTFQEIDLPIGQIIFSRIDNDAKKATYYFTDSRLHRFEIDDTQFRNKRAAFPELVIRSIDDIELYDINHDGFQDLFFATRWGGAVAYLEGAQGKKFGEMKPVAFDEEGALDLALDDFDQDGKIDIAYSSIWTGNLAVKYGDGQGGFADKVYLKEDWGLVRGSTSGDFEGDGYPDILLSTISTNETIIYRNHNGEFQAPVHINTGNSYDPLETRDIDFDGDPDVLAHTYGAGGSYILIYENDGSGQLTYNGYFLPTNSWNEFFLDFDGDGRDEFVGASETAVTVWRFDVTEYTPWITVEIPDINTSYPFVVLDYNGDGLLDLIVEDSNPLNHRLYKNVNNEEFIFDDLASEKLSIKLPEFRKADEYVVDLDQDGDYDLLYSPDDYRMYRISNLAGDRSIKGNAFWDVSNDSIFDADEFGIRDVRIDVTDSEGKISSTFSNEKGHYEIFVDTGAHQIQAIALNDCWKASFEEPYNMQVSDAGLQSINFPFTGEGEGSSIVVSLSRAATRCGFTIRYFATILNSGCNPIYGRATYDLDPLVSQFVEISLDEFTLDGNQIQIPFETLLPGESMSFNMLVTVPGVEFLGDFLKDEINVYYDLIDGSVQDQQITRSFSSEIRCAFDPNDKIASPDRRDIYEKSYIIDEPIFYTLRFQNTGNDTAFNIRLTDTLSDLLDLSTFRPIDASHTYRLEIDNDNRSLQVFFDDILLPDSTVNQVGSNGFFTFSIEPVKELEDFTPIANSAAIYFDFNPPIFTDEMKLEYVSDLSLIVTSIETPSERKTILYPNPNNGTFSISSEEMILSLQIFDLTGKERSVAFDGNTVNAEDLEPGLFTILVEMKSGFYFDRVVIIR